MLSRHFTAQDIKPRGWLARQLRIQANGLSGNLDKMWPDIRDSRWIGGSCDGWERVPYWLDGFIPLAYLLDDADMKSRAQRYIDAIIDGQCEDGWLCPCSDDERTGYDMWALFLIGKVLTVYYDCTSDERVPDVLYAALKNLAGHIEANKLFNWAKHRWFECLVPIYFVYDRCGEDWLLALAREIGAQGMDFDALYGENWPYYEPRTRWEFDSHVVNQAMAIKAGALASLADGKTDDSLSRRMYDMLTKYHGTAVGHFTGDECLSGDSPTQGTELCGVVEAMYSYELLYEMTGDGIWADRLEMLAFNALPATCSADMWTHQYDQMTNQIACVRFEPSIFRTNNENSAMFGLEPHYGCCTANFNQGWPKFALSTFYRTEDGVASCSIAPCVLSTVIDGKRVEIICDTAYPFGCSARYIVTASEAVGFALSLRIPSCASGARVDGREVVPGSVEVIDRIWEGRSEIMLELDFAVEFVPRPRDMFTLRRGPLVYTLDIGESATAREYSCNGVEHRFPYCDYEIRPTTPWQYAFASCDASSVKVTEGSIPCFPFSHLNPAVTLDVEMYPIDWGYREGYDTVAAMVPQSKAPCGDKVTVKFKPYGASNLHLTEIPMAQL